MPLDNMRALGVRTITVHRACGHAGQADVSALADGSRGPVDALPASLLGLWLASDRCAP